MPDAEPVCPDPAEAEEVDEDELEDLQEKFRKMCQAAKPCATFSGKLNSCNDRVNSKTKTAETCLEEVIDYVSCVDHCAAKKFFAKLK